MELIIYFQTCKNIRICKQYKACEFDMNTLRKHSPRLYMAWLPMTLSVLDMIVFWSGARWRPRRLFRKFTVRFWPIRIKLIIGSLYFSWQLGCLHGRHSSSMGNPLHPNISMHILHTVFYIFPEVLTRRICFPIKRFLPCWPFPLFSLP